MSGRAERKECNHNYQLSIINYQLIGMFIKIVLTIIFVAVMIAVGLYSRKQAASVDGFVLGGRTVGPWLTAFAYGTSYFSAVVFVGYAGQFGWKYGLSSTWIGVGNAVVGSLLAWIVLGRRTKLMTQHIESRTMPDFFGTRYQSQGLRVVASIIAFVFLIPYTAGVYKGISTLFEMGFGVPYEYCVILMAILTAVYVILGGYKATAMNDFIQGVIMLFGIITVIAAVLSSQGGLSAAVEKMASLPADNASTNGGFATLWGPDPWNLLGVVVLTSLGTWGLPQLRLHRGWRMLLPRWFRTPLRYTAHAAQWPSRLRFYHPFHVGHAARFHHCTYGVVGAVGIDVDASLAGANLVVDDDARPDLSRQKVAAR